MKIAWNVDNSVVGILIVNRISNSVVRISENEEKNRIEDDYERVDPVLWASKGIIDFRRSLEAVKGVLVCIASEAKLSSVVNVLAP